MATHEDMIASYVKLRDTKNKIIERHKKELKPYNEGMEEIGQFLLDYLRKQKLQSVATKEATAFLRHERSATVADMDLFRKHVIANEDFDLADFRAKKDAVEDYIKSHDGQLPPGVNFSTTIVVSVQRK